MNKQRLHQIFANYIDSFELINNNQNNENYKWEIANQFRNLMNPDSPDFVENIKEAWKLSSNLIDSSNRYCFSALVVCAEKAPEEIKSLFKNLFANDFGDLSIRQNKILKFIDDANSLVSKYHSNNGVFMNDQRSAMAYLFLYDPDNHYLYKASEARSFASCVEFYTDWRSGADFQLDVYYRMCDCLVEEIKNSEELLKTNASRYFDKHGKRIDNMHPDNNFHILAFDIIYGAPEFRYNFYKGIPFSNITTQARKLHDERTQKAREIFADLQAIQAEANLYAKAQDYFISNISIGLSVKHKIFGEGKITEIDNNNIYVLFTKSNQVKKLPMMSSFTEKFLTADIHDLNEKILQYKSIVKKGHLITSSLERVTQALEPYKEYLE